MKTFALQYWNSQEKAWWTACGAYTSITDAEELWEMELDAIRYRKNHGAMRFRIIEITEKPIKGFKLEKPE